MAQRLNAMVSPLVEVNKLNKVDRSISQLKLNEFRLTTKLMPDAEY